MIEYENKMQLVDKFANKYIGNKIGNRYNNVRLDSGGVWWQLVIG